MQIEAPQQAASAPALPLRPKVKFRTLTLHALPCQIGSFVQILPVLPVSAEAEPITPDLGTRPYAECWGASPLHVVSKSAQHNMYWI